MVAPRGFGEATYGNLGINIAGIKEEEDAGRESYIVRARGMRILTAVSRDAGTETVDARVVG